MKINYIVYLLLAVVSLLSPSCRTIGELSKIRADLNTPQALAVQTILQKKSKAQIRQRISFIDNRLNKLKQKKRVVSDTQSIELEIDELKNEKEQLQTAIKQLQKRSEKLSSILKKFNSPASALWRGHAILTMSQIDKRYNLFINMPQQHDLLLATLKKEYLRPRASDVNSRKLPALCIDNIDSLSGPPQVAYLLNNLALLSNQSRIEKNSLSSILNALYAHRHLLEKRSSYRQRILAIVARMTAKHQGNHYPANNLLDGFVQQFRNEQNILDLLKDGSLDSASLHYLLTWNFNNLKNNSKNIDKNLKTIQKYSHYSDRKIRNLARLTIQTFNPVLAFTIISEKIITGNKPFADDFQQLTAMLAVTDKVINRCPKVEQQKYQNCRQQLLEIIFKQIKTQSLQKREIIYSNLVHNDKNALLNNFYKYVIPLAQEPDSYRQQYIRYLGILKDTFTAKTPNYKHAVYCLQQALPRASLAASKQIYAQLIKNDSAQLIEIIAAITNRYGVKTTNAKYLLEAYLAAIRQNKQIAQIDKTKKHRLKEPNQYLKYFFLMNDLTIKKKIAHFLETRDTDRLIQLIITYCTHRKTQYLTINELAFVGDVATIHWSKIAKTERTKLLNCLKVWLQHRDNQAKLLAASYILELGGDIDKTQIGKLPEAVQTIWKIEMQHRNEVK